MDKIHITGGRALRGTVSVSGSKNAALPILFSTLLTDQDCVIHNVPALADIETTVRFLEYLGKSISRSGHSLRVIAHGPLRTDAPYDLVRRMRASALVMGPLLARMGHVSVALPGGCAIGARPVDIHLDGFKAMGAAIELSRGDLRLSAHRLRGTHFRMRFPSVGATENLMMCAAAVPGTSVIENAAREPEIADLGLALARMGARVRGAGTHTITIEGAKVLGGLTHTVIPDRIEAATFLIAAALTRGSITLKHAEPSHLRAVLRALTRAGLEVAIGEGTISCRWTRVLKPVSIRTAVHPGFPTDVQAQWMALMAVTKGHSAITETVFENRFLHVCELQRLGADLEVHGRAVRVTGVDRLSGAPVMVSDLRAGAALVLAGLAARGLTTVSRIYHLDRGYERLEAKLKTLGARIRRVRS